MAEEGPPQSALPSPVRLPASVANRTASITATVSNDSAAKGVTWSCTPASSCGSFNPTATASGTATTYTAPGAAGSVVVTATSVSDTTKTATATISIAVSQVTLADGNYVYALSRLRTANPKPRNTLDGVFTVASGKISAGEQDFVDDTNGDLHDALNPTGSGYTTTTDGNLQLTLVTCAGSTCTSVDNLIGPGGNGIETINGLAGFFDPRPLDRVTTRSPPPAARSMRKIRRQQPRPRLALISSRPADLEGLAGGGILNFSGATVSTTGTVVDLNHGWHDRTGPDHQRRLRASTGCIGDACSSK